MQSTALSEQLLFVTVRLQVQKPSGTATGTGFLYSVPSGKDHQLPLLFTNKHVVKGGVLLKTQFHVADTAGQPILDKSEAIEIPLPEGQFIPHPNNEVDLCAFPIGPMIQKFQAAGRPLYTPWLDPVILPNAAQLNELTAIEEVVMVGYPIGLWDEANNLPLIRRGITASHPSVAFNGKPWAVIDAACFPGSSGSPILILNEGAYTQRGTGITIGTRVFLLGALFAYPKYETDGRIEIRPIPTSSVSVPIVPQTSHLGFYVRGEAIKELGELILKMQPAPSPP